MLLVNQAKRASLRKAEEAKADATLRKERIVGVMQDKVRQREAEVRDSGRDVTMISRSRGDSSLAIVITSRRADTVV